MADLSLFYYILPNTPLCYVSEEIISVDLHDKTIDSL